MTFEQQANIIKSVLESVLERYGRELQFLVDAYVFSDNVNFDSTAPFSFNQGNKLNTGSGDLKRSFEPGGGVTNVEVNGSKLKVTYGSKLIYASVHEEGMFIKSKGKMANYFWYRYYETKKEFFKIIALSVLAKGGVQIKKREYFQKGIDEFKKDGLPKFLQQVLNEVIRELNKN